MDTDSERTYLEDFSLEPIFSFTKHTLHLLIPLLYKPEFRARGKQVVCFRCTHVRDSDRRQNALILSCHP